VFNNSTMIAATGVLNVVERAYDVHQPVKGWLKGVAEEVRLNLDQGGGVLAFFIDAHDPELPPIQDAVPSGIGNFWEGWLEQMNGMPRELLRYARGLPPLLYKSHFTFAAMANVPAFRMYDCGPLRPPRSAEEILARDEAEGLPWAECLALHAADPASRDVFVVAPSVRRAQSLPSFDELDLWGRVAAHIANAARLQSLVARLGHRPLAGAEAILAPGGSVQYAEGAAKTRTAQDVLRDAARRVERARTKKARARPELALDVWQGLVAGRWSLVDEFDSDGRRFLVVRRNDLAASEPALSDRERQVAAHIALGHSNKLIAYQLGVSLSTVSSYARRVARKLGTTNRVELVARCSTYVESLRAPSAASSRRPRTPSFL
jgi:DNA-binding CsgD family transcriptional regulator